MELVVLAGEFTVCRLASAQGAPTGGGFVSLTRTADEISLVCETRLAPGDALAREDGWRALKVAGVLDFGMVGVLAQSGVPLFVVSTYNTDYVLVKAADLRRATAALEGEGHRLAFGETAGG